MSTQARAAWYPDPFRRFEHRYWDGRQWTHHVSSQGQQWADPPVMSQPQSGPHEGTHHAPVPWAEPALLTTQVLVIDQKVARSGSNVAYTLRDQHMRWVGTVEEVRGFRKRRKQRKQGADDASRKYELQVVDPYGQVIFRMTRPHNWWKSKLKVTTATGQPIGEIAQDTFGFIRGPRFRIESAGQPLGSIHTNDSDRTEFTVKDSDDSEIAVLTKKWAGWFQERFTTADNYVLQINRQLTEPLRSLVIATALAIDLALKQGDPTREGFRGIHRPNA